MSYCVNCGVELDESLKTCPLCNTPVVNPNEIPRRKSISPFPKEKGQVEEVKRKDIAILFSILLLTIAITCGLLNFLVFDATKWSLLVIGVCMLLWVLFIPLLIYRKINAYLALLSDGIAVVLYLYMITYLTSSEKWFWNLALPITIFVILIAEMLTVCIRQIPRSFLMNMLLFFVTVAVLCVGIELLIDRFLGKSLWITWSAVVLTVCVIISIVLITMLSQRRVRNAVRRRLHF